MGTVTEVVGLAFLGIIALSCVVQTALILKATRNVADLQVRFEENVRPALERMAEVTRNLEQITDVAARQLPELEAAVEEATDRLRNAGAPLARLFATGSALMGVFRAVRPGGIAARLLRK